MENSAFNNFKPQSDREAALYEMIGELRKDLEALKASNRGLSDPNFRSWQESKSGRLFLANDKNRDGVLSLSEWMTLRDEMAKQEEKERRDADRRMFQQVDPNTDGSLSPDEFSKWYEAHSPHSRIRFSVQRDHEEKQESGGNDATRHIRN